MKKSILLIFLLLIPLASAVEFQVADSYNRGETLITKISGNFLDSILPENIYFYRGHVKVPLFFDVAKISDDYYIYALLLDTQVQPLANYSIVIKDVRYYKGSQIIDDELKRNFTISENLADFSANPGFVITNQDFSIKIQNLNENKIDVSSQFLNDSQLATLKSGEIKKLNFLIQGVNQTSLQILTLTSQNTIYEIPVYIYINKTSSQINATESENFRFNPIELNFSMSTNSNKTKYIYLYNTGNKTLENIELEISEELKPYVTLSIYEIGELEEGSEIKIEFYAESGEETYIEGFVTAVSEDYSADLPVLISFEKDYVPSEKDTENENPDEKPSIPDTNKTDDSSNFISMKVIGWAILVIIVLALAWFYLKKYKKTEKKVDLLGIGNARSKERKRRFGLKPKEMEDMD